MTRSLLIALVGLVVAVAALVLFQTQNAVESERSQAMPAPSVEIPAPAGRDPSFDVVRIGEQGDIVIAGRALPKAEILVLDGDREIGRAVADERGEWVLVPQLALEPGPRQFLLEARNPDGTVTKSREPVILVVPERVGDPAIALKPSGAGGPALLQGPAAADGAGTLSIDIVDSDADSLFVGGRAEPGARIQLYLDNRLMGRGRADAGGGWKVTGKALSKGAAHILRADHVDAKGKVLGRVEIPYDAGMEIVAPGSIVVRPGNSLWRIARRLYGSGPAFTIIYQANKDRIRDPDRIYPGQVFSVPAR